MTTDWQPRVVLVTEAEYDAVKRELVARIATMMWVTKNPDGIALAANTRGQYALWSRIADELLASAGVIREDDDER